MNKIDLVEKRISLSWGKNSLEKNEKNFLNKYLISEVEFKDMWEETFFSIFKSHLIFPENIFKDNYEKIILTGGILFTREELVKLKHCFHKTLDKWFLIIEDSPSNQIDRFLLKFPVETQWEELLNGGEVSLEIFERPIRNYFVFGNSGLWGKYAGNDYEDPLDIWGFRKEIADIFIKNLGS